MNSVRQLLWKVLVVGMIPFILGAGLPQMECQCAAAKGQRYCECCFRKPGDPRTGNAALKPCCRHQLASRTGRVDSAVVQSASGCPTCQQFTNAATGSCCSLKLTQAPTLTEPVNVSQFEAVTLWLPLVLDAQPSSVNSLAALQNVRTLACCRIPPLDRVIVFEHLVI